MPARNSIKSVMPWILLLFCFFLNTVNKHPASVSFFFYLFKFIKFFSRQPEGNFDYFLFETFHSIFLSRWAEGKYCHVEKLKKKITQAARNFCLKKKNFSIAGAFLNFSSQSLAVYQSNFFGKGMKKIGNHRKVNTHERAFFSPWSSSDIQIRVKLNTLFFFV